VWQLQTNPWRVPVEQTTKTDCNLRFQCPYYDAEIGLHHKFHRYSDPETGRYLISDTIELEGGLNTFGYVKNP
jgi:RHS repeat-associated protein